MNLRPATSYAFGAAFFCLPLSKPLTLISLGLGALLFITALASGAAAGARSAAGPRTRRPPAWAVAAAVLAALPVLSLFVHDDGLANAEYLALAYYWLLALLVHEASRRMPIEGWLVAFVSGTLLVFAYTQLRLLGWQPPGSEPSALRNAILYSQFLLAGILVCALLHRATTRRGTRIACWVAIGLLAFGLATGTGQGPAGGTRLSGALTLLALMPLLAACLVPIRHARAVVAACVLGGAALLATPPVQTRIGQVVNDVEQWQQANPRTSLGYRLEMWRTAGELVGEHPVAGSGPKAFQRAWAARFPAQEERFDEPHSAYLFYAAAYGLPGLAALICLFGALLYRGWRHLPTLAGGLTFGFAVFCVLAGLANTLFVGTTSALMLMLFIGLQGAFGRPTPHGVDTRA